MEEVIGAVLGGFVGAALASVVAWRRLHVERSQWQMDAVVTAMGFLTGGRQVRSVGIGVIEALIMSADLPARIRPAVDSVLWNQLVYVVHEGELGKRHEQVNAARLVALLRRSPRPEAIAQYSSQGLEEMAERVRRAA
jgi:hypothetical protein